MTLKKVEQDKARKEKQTEIEIERVKRNELIEKRKQRFYQQLKQAEEKQKAEKAKAMADAEEAPQRDVTKLDQGVLSKRSSKATLSQISELTSTSIKPKFKPLDLIVMDGNIKSLTTEWVEEGGMIFEKLRVESIPELDEEIPREPPEETPGELAMEEEPSGADDTIMDETESLVHDDPEYKSITRLQTTDGVPFDKFLDLMEFF